MKIIKNGRVYDLDYSKYRSVVRIPTGYELNAVDNVVSITRELRQDVASGEFYVLKDDGRYNGRESFAIEPVSREAAMKIAEDYLDYDGYVKFFGDPEGADKRLERERDEAVKGKKEAEDSKNYWYEESEKRGKRIAELEKRVAELEAK